jgi:NAD(P)-dependent dehydrogenase (short-subunit alcohol dehydrogenase family)
MPVSRRSEAGIRGGSNAAAGHVVAAQDDGPHRRIAWDRSCDGETILASRLAHHYLLASAVQPRPLSMGPEDHVQVDLADHRALPLAIADIRARLKGGPLHALVNNAGISPKTADNARMTSLTTSTETWMSVFHVNFLAPILLARGLFEELKSGGGTVVNVTSLVGARVHPFAGTAYATSKATLSSLTREMAHDFAPHGIRVNAIAPGEIRTDILSPDTEARFAPIIPMRRIGTPEEVANVVFFLCSDAASYVPGEEIQINGGQHL